VDLGGKEMTVVCGAPNLNVNDKIAFALVGAKLIDGHTGKMEELKPAKIRGVASEGMICAEKELGISDNYEGILVLPPEYEIGKPLSDYLGDTILDIDITPNRADCLSVMGIAREAAAIAGKPFRLPEIQYAESSRTVASLASVEIKAPDLCPRYCATVIEDLKIAPSPKWMQDRLSACGMRPINNVVDVTNYVMLEYGQPLHAFDYQEIRGRKIVVRRAAEGEIMYTLDEVERKYSSDILLIADDERAVAVAGIMGGLSSEVRDFTTTILLESANFSQAAIHRGSQQLKLSSEASVRFEKGLNPEVAAMAVRRATQLMVELGGGKASAGVIDIFPGKKQEQPIEVSPRDVKRLLGIDLDSNTIKRHLVSLGIECSVDQGGKVNARRPWWRNDINCTADLVEEVARVTGYENIPETLLSSPLPRGQSNPFIAFRQDVREMAISCGFQEIITYPLTSVETIRKLSPLSDLVGPDPLRMANAMSRELEYLRTSLRSGLLSTFARNQRNREGNVRLFEVGRVYLPRKQDLPKESEILCGVVDSVMQENYWQPGGRKVDYYLVKGIVETILNKYGVKADYAGGADPSMNPAVCADIMVNKAKIGTIGEVHPAVIQHFDIGEPVFLFELDLDKLFALSVKQVVYMAASKYPGTTRDLALVLDADVAYETVARLIKSYNLVSDVMLFDVYAGDRIPQGKKSMAFRLVFQADDHTLKDEEVENVQKRILEKLNKELGAVLRS
jgi:phenylalanyl-tRNA synthetase beta chain